jgi:hypothetical protein
MAPVRVASSSKGEAWRENNQVVAVVVEVAVAVDEVRVSPTSRRM